jgi:hypothetical protein
MMRRCLALLLLILACACGRPPVQDEVTIAFSSNSELVTVTAETRFDTDAKGDAVRKRLDTAQQAALSDVDPWAVRFARLTPETERATFQKQRGALELVTRTVSIPDDDLPRIFSDAGITVNVLRGDGWRELAMYPGASGRATREQQRHFDEELSAWSNDVARYFGAVRSVYAYLDEHPERATFVFAALVASKEETPAVTDEEAPLVTAVVESMAPIAARMDAQNGRAETFAETADLIFNPFPARMVVRVPGHVILTEGFTPAEKELVIEPVDLLKAITSLEGRWISPDPLAALLRDQVPAPEQLAEMPRHTTPVAHSSDVAAALREQLVRPKSYVVRWRD